MPSFENQYITREDLERALAELSSPRVTNTLAEESIWPRDEDEAPGLASFNATYSIGTTSNYTENPYLNVSEDGYNIEGFVPAAAQETWRDTLRRFLSELDCHVTVNIWETCHDDGRWVMAERVPCSMEDRGE